MRPVSRHNSHHGILSGGERSRCSRALPLVVILATATVASMALAAQSAQRTDAFVESRDHPAIAYSTAEPRNPITDLNSQIQQGTLRLPFDRATGYLKPLLDALHISIDSQALVFSQGSLQGRQIGPTHPRAIYFNDTTAVGWVRDAELLEVAVHDPRQGAVFYTLPQTPLASPRVERDDRCLLCHLTWDTLGVPGFQVLSTFQMSDPNGYASGLVSDHRTLLSDRWGGWYVTGQPGTSHHRGNVPVVVKPQELQNARSLSPQLTSVASQFETRGFPSEHSDVVALMVLEHQTRMANLLTRVGWETRVALQPADTAIRQPAAAPGLPPRVLEAVRDLVDYLLFVDEAPLAGPVRGSSGFTQRFSQLGPTDSHGRSLRQFDLARRMFRYPCSYMIYSPAFEALVPAAKDAVYQRMWAILSGADRDRQYAQLPAADRLAIVEILRDTKRDLPALFSGAVK